MPDTTYFFIHILYSRDIVYINNMKFLTHVVLCCFLACKYMIVYMRGCTPYGVPRPVAISNFTIETRILIINLCGIAWCMSNIGQKFLIQNKKEKPHINRKKSIHLSYKFLLIKCENCKEKIYILIAFFLVQLSKLHYLIWTYLCSSP